MAGKKKKKIVRPAAYTPKKAEYKPMSKKTKLGILIGVCVLAVAIVLFALLYDDGSLKVSGGAIKGAQENWLSPILHPLLSRHKYLQIRRDRAAGRLLPQHGRFPQGRGRSGHRLPG